jgi:hypothetical protein
VVERARQVGAQRRRRISAAVVALVSVRASSVRARSCSAASSRSRCAAAVHVQKHESLGSVPILAPGTGLRFKHPRFGRTRLKNSTLDAVRQSSLTSRPSKRLLRPPNSIGKQACCPRSSVDRAAVSQACRRGCTERCSGCRSDECRAERRRGRCTSVQHRCRSGPPREKRECRICRPREARRSARARGEWRCRGRRAGAGCTAEACRPARA